MGYGKIKSKHIFKKVNIQAQKNSEMIILLKHSHSRLLFGELLNSTMSISYITL